MELWLKQYVYGRAILTRNLKVLRSALSVTVLFTLPIITFLVLLVRLASTSSIRLVYTNGFQLPTSQLAHCASLHSNLLRKVGSYAKGENPSYKFGRAIHINFFMSRQYSGGWIKWDLCRMVVWCIHEYLSMLTSHVKQWEGKYVLDQSSVNEIRWKSHV